MKQSIKSPIFIVGLHRAGSTLWHNLVSMSPGVVRLTDMRFVSHWWQQDVTRCIRRTAGDLNLDANVDNLVKILFARKSPPLPGMEAAFWRFENHGDVVSNPNFQSAVADRIKKSDRSMGAIFRSVIDCLTEATGEERACVKFPVDVGHVQKLLDWYPGCKIVHITRDPRAMAMSKTNDPGGTAIKVKRHPKLAAVIRRAAMGLVMQQYWSTARTHEKYKSLANYRLFQYEDLLANPEETLRSLCKFAECEFVPEMLHPEKGRHEHQASSLTGTRQLAFDKSAASRWLEVISPVDRWMISALTRPSMRKFGYYPERHPLFVRHST